MNAIPKRPPFGLSLPCRVMGIMAADCILLHLPRYFEIELILIDCVAPPADLPSENPLIRRINPDWHRSIETARDEIAGAVATVAYIPQPSRDEGWVRHIAPGSRHAGYLYLDETHTLNERLIAAGVCRYPRGRVAI